MNITPIVKDQVLNAFCDEGAIEQIATYDLEETLNRTQTDFDTLHAILNQFQDLGLISGLNMRRGGALKLCVKTQAVDIQKRGGFVGQEE